MTRILMAIAGVMGARLAGAGFGFLSQLMLARMFLPHDVGMAFLAMSVTAFVSLMATGGYHTIALTYLARFRAFGRLNLERAFLSAARRDIFVLIALFLVVTPFAFVLPLEDGFAKAALFGVLAAIPLAVIRMNNSVANAHKRFSLSYVPDFVIRPGLLLLFLAALALLRLNAPIDYVLIAMVVIALTVAIGQALLLGKDHAFARVESAHLRDLRPYYRSRAAAMLMVTIVSGATADLVILIGGLFLPPSQVAVLGVAVRLAALVGFFSAASQQFVLRDLVATMSSANRSESDALLLRTNIISIGNMIAATVVAIIIGPFVLALFGPAYGAGYWPLVIFLISQSIRVMGGMNGHLLALGGHQIRSAALCALAVIVLLLLSALLTPLWGLTGIATALLVAELVWAVGLGWLTQKLQGRRGDIFETIRTHKLFTAGR
ncbi:hypothetical protein [Devosia sp. MC1541]|uniref:lipopolysaccharide biosynthesis protein n=1 Tax=Devosia sp. MC1541 TaxID=2725264 RepID=UPI00145FCC14|nr:hypothetical protein [Devosia sp. MC1541]